MRPFRVFRAAPVALALLGILLLLEVQRRFLDGCAQPASLLLRTDGTRSPPPPSPCAERRSIYELQPHLLPRGLPGAADEPLHLTFATASVDELLSNWVAHVRWLRLPAVVSAMDSAVFARCSRLRVRCLPTFDELAEDAMRQEAMRYGQRDASFVNIRGNPTLFISLGARKVSAILMLLHTSGRPILVSDVDVVWMANPKRLLSGALPGYEDFAHADVLASSDCLDPKMDVADHGCFHVLQDRNTGVLLVRNTTAGRAAMFEWKARTAGAFQAWETDQTAFDDMLRGRGRGHRRNMSAVQRTAWFAHKKDWCGFPKWWSEAQSMGTQSDVDGWHANGSRRLFDVCIPNVARALRFGLLPITLIANGHTFFVQQLQLQSGVWPYAVHATYQFEDQVDCAFGKRERMREWGIWRADEPIEGGEEAEEDGCAPSAALVEAPADDVGERFLVLDEDPPIESAARWLKSDPHARGRQHVAHLDRFRQRLADGVLLARALNRTVVLPPFYCYCDKYWSRLTQCTVGAQAIATQPLPFRCPMDHVVPISGWHGSGGTRKERGVRCALPNRADGPPENGFPYRSHSWLHVASRRSHLATMGATLLPANGSTVAADASEPRHGAELLRGVHVPLPAGNSEAQLRRLVDSKSEMLSRPMLRVALSDARALLGCVSDRGAASRLLLQLFRVQWCWRPEEMVDKRIDPKTGAEIDVCVWGLATPTPPPQCP